MLWSEPLSESQVTLQKTPCVNMLGFNTGHHQTVWVLQPQGPFSLQSLGWNTNSCSSPGHVEGTVTDPPSQRRRVLTLLFDLLLAPLLLVSAFGHLVPHGALHSLSLLSLQPSWQQAPSLPWPIRCWCFNCWTPATLERCWKTQPESTKLQQEVSDVNKPRCLEKHTCTEMH